MTRPRLGGTAVGWYRGTNAVVDQAIAANSTWTQQIDLGVSGLNMGDAKLYIPASITATDHRRLHGEVYYTDDIDDGFSRMDQYFIKSLDDTECNGGPTPGDGFDENFYETHLYRYVDDAVLSYHTYHATGGAVRLDSAVINGQYLDLVWRNINGFVASTITVTVEARATRI